MAPPLQYGSKFATIITILLFTVAFMFSLTLLLPPKSGAGGWVLNEGSNNKAVIGSKPPECVNKCMKCRPCMATVVIPNHKTRRISKQQQQQQPTFNFNSQSHDEDDSYYLLSWRCRCGNKLFHP